MRYLISIVLLIAISCYINTSINGQTYVFNQKEAITKAIATNTSETPSIWAPKNGGKLLTFGEEWCLSDSDYIVYRHLTLLLIFPSNNVSSDISGLRDRAQSTPILADALNKKEASIYNFHLNQDYCGPLEDFLFENFTQGLEAKDDLAGKLGQLDRLVRGVSTQASKKGKPEDDKEAFDKMGQAEETFFKGFVCTDPECEKLYGALRSTYGVKIDPKDYLTTPEEVFKELVDDKYKKQIDEEDAQSKDTNQPPSQPGQANPKQNNQNQTASSGASGNSSNSSKGLKGPFKIKNPFSKWFAIVIKVVAKYFGVEQLGMKVLTLAYIISPELFDYCASFLAKCQKALTAKTLDDFLNQAADIYENLEKFLGYAIKVYNLVYDQRLTDLVNKIDWKKFDLKKIVNEANKMGVLSNKHLKKIKQFVPLDALNGKVLTTPQSMAEQFTKFGAGHVAKKIDKGLRKAGVPINFSSLNNCVSFDADLMEKCGKEWTKTQAANVITQKVPGLKGHDKAISYSLEGDFEKAAEAVAIQELAHRTGLPTSSIKGMYESLKNEDHKEFILNAIDAGMSKVNECNELTEDVLQRLRKNKVVKEKVLVDISTCILEVAGKKKAAKRVKSSGLAMVNWADEVRRSGSLKKWAKGAGTSLEKQVKPAVKKTSGLNSQQAAKFVNGQASEVIKEVTKKELRSNGINNEAALETMLNKGNLQEGFNQQIGAKTRPKRSKPVDNSQRLSLRNNFIEKQLQLLHHNMNDPAWVERYLFQKSLNLK